MEDDECAKLFAEDLKFSIPEGVDFISHNEKVHFSSILALHPASRTIHSDDTLMYMRLPILGLSGGVRFHPTLAQALEQRAGAASDFRNWARSLIEDWGHAENLCVAHNAPLLTTKPLRGHIQKALKRTGETLAAYERKYG